MEVTFVLQDGTSRTVEAEDGVQFAVIGNTTGQDMLASTFGVREDSRLSCQIRTSEALDGLTVEVVGS